LPAGSLGVLERVAIWLNQTSASPDLATKDGAT